MSRVRRWARAVHWYLREVTGEADYDRYLARHGAAPGREGPAHPACPPLTRREFETRRWTDRAERPGHRCC